MSEVYDLDSKVIIIDGTSLLVEKTGTIHRYLKNGDLKLIKNTANHRCGYNQIHCSGKKRMYLRHRIIAYAYLGLDINNQKLMVDHINRNTLNNCVENLRIVSNQQNLFNTNAKGYYWNKQSQKYVAQIKVNNKRIYLGHYEKEEDAREAYLNAKAIHHII